MVLIYTQVKNYKLFPTFWINLKKAEKDLIESTIFDIFILSFARATGYVFNKLKLNSSTGNSTQFIFCNRTQNICYLYHLK